VRDTATGVERVHEGITAGVLVERVDEAAVRAHGACDRRALHHPPALRAVGDRSRQETLGREVVLAHEVASQVRRRHVLDEEEPAAVGRERVEREVAFERDRLVAECLRIDEPEGR